MPTDICVLPFVNLGISNMAPFVASSKSIVKPLSASTRSHVSNKSRNLHLFVISLSETLPPQPCDKKLTAPAGVIDIKYLIVLLFLYDNQV